MRVAFIFKALLTLVLLALASGKCGTHQPGVADQRFDKPAADHTRFTAPCATCHEETRFPANVDIDAKGAALTVAHGFGRSCGECHEYAKAAPSWLPTAHTHTAADVSCLGCHYLASEGNPHTPRGDCVSCHSFPQWSVTR